MGAASQLPPMKVAEEFTRIYYGVTARMPNELRKLYGESSMLDHGAPHLRASGLQSISKIAHNLPLSNYHAKVHSVVGQSLAANPHDGSVLIVATGTYGPTDIHFSQTFVLAKQADSRDGHFYCSNDIFCTLNNDDAPPAPTSSATAAASASNPESVKDTQPPQPAPLAKDSTLAAHVDQNIPVNNQQPTMPVNAAAPSNTSVPALKTSAANTPSKVAPSEAAIAEIKADPTNSPVHTVPQQAPAHQSAPTSTTMPVRDTRRTHEIGSTDTNAQTVNNRGLPAANSVTAASSNSPNSSTKPNLVPSAPNTSDVTVNATSAANMLNATSSNSNTPIKSQSSNVNSNVENASTPNSNNANVRQHHYSQHHHYSHHHSQQQMQQQANYNNHQSQQAQQKQHAHDMNMSNHVNDVGKTGMMNNQQASVNTNNSNSEDKNANIKKSWAAIVSSKEEGNGAAMMNMNSSESVPQSSGSGGSAGIGSTGLPNGAPTSTATSENATSIVGTEGNHVAVDSTKMSPATTSAANEGVNESRNVDIPSQPALDSSKNNGSSIGSNENATTTVVQAGSTPPSGNQGGNQYNSNGNNQSHSHYNTNGHSSGGGMNGGGGGGRNYANNGFVRGQSNNYNISNNVNSANASGNHAAPMGGSRTFGPSAVVTLSSTGMNMSDLRGLSAKLREEFCQYGHKLRGVEVKANKGIAFIEYESVEGVKAAVEAWAHGPRQEGGFKGVALHVSEKRTSSHPYAGRRPGGMMRGRGGPRGGGARRGRPTMTTPPMA